MLYRDERHNSSVETWEIHNKYSALNHVYLLRIQITKFKDSSFNKFQRKIFGQKSLYLKEIISFRQKLGMILEEKGV